MHLILYSRVGCCLCEGLEERLRSIPLNELKPSLDLHVIDIDGIETPQEIRDRYSFEVPVMALGGSGLGGDQPLELPRVSPRLAGNGLHQWLQKVLFQVNWQD